MRKSGQQHRRVRSRWRAIEPIVAYFCVLFMVQSSGLAVGVFDGFLVEGSVEEIERKSVNLMTGEVIEGSSRISDVVVKIDKVHVGPKELMDKQFSAQGRLHVEIEGERVALCPVTAVGVGHAKQDKFKLDERGLWHITRADARRRTQRAFPFSSIMSVLYDSYIPFSAEQAGAWKIWAQRLGESIPAGTASLASLRDLCANETPEVSTWACHAIARSFGKAATNQLYSILRDLPKQAQAGILIGVDEALAEIDSNAWLPSSDRISLYENLIRAGRTERDADLIGQRIRFAFQKGTYRWPDTELLNLCEVALLAPEVHRNVKRASVLFAVAALRDADTSQETFDSVLNIAKQLNGGVRKTLLQSINRYVRLSPQRRTAIERIGGSN